MVKNPWYYFSRVTWDIVTKKMSHANIFARNVIDLKLAQVLKVLSMLQWKPLNVITG